MKTEPLKPHDHLMARIAFQRGGKLVERVVTGQALVALLLLMDHADDGVDKHCLPDGIQPKVFQRAVGTLRRLGLIISTRRVPLLGTWFGRYRLHQNVAFVHRADGQSIHTAFVPTAARPDDYVGQEIFADEAARPV
jgi:hypothetical protein